MKTTIAQTLKSAVLPALITALLALPLAGLQLQDLGGKNGLNIRPLWVIVPTIIVFIGHCLVQLLRNRNKLQPKVPRQSRASTYIAHVSPRLFLMIGIVAVVFPMLPFTSRYELDLATTFLIYVMLGWGLNIVVGMAGLLDLGYVAFYAAGAYTFGYLSVNYGVSFWVALPLCGLVSASLGILLGFPVLRLRGDYLAIVTLGFGEIIRIFLINLTDITGGPNGIAGIARPTFLATRSQQPRRMEYRRSPIFSTWTFRRTTASCGSITLFSAWQLSRFSSLKDCVACPSAGHGKPCAKTKLPVRRWVSILHP